MIGTHEHAGEFKEWWIAPRLNFDPLRLNLYPPRGDTTLPQINQTGEPTFKTTLLGRFTR